jgi:hypothetical protein
MIAAMPSESTPESPSKLIDARIRELSDWRGEMLSRIRRLIKQADPEVVVKLTFARGAALADPAGLFNASLEGKARRAIDLHEGDEIDEGAFKSLVRAAAALNAS